MNFKELIEKHKNSMEKIAGIAASLHNFIPKLPPHKEAQKREIQKKTYLILYLRLLKIKPSKNKMKIQVYKNHIYGTLPNSKDTYALDFQKWDKWLGSEIEHTCKSPLKTVAYCLYEMTFHGYDQRAIQNRLRGIQDQVKRIKSGKGKGKTFKNVDEMKKYFDSKFKIKKKK